MPGSPDVGALDWICRELDSLDTGDGLPAALTRPDFVGAKVMCTDDGEVVLVDWTGAGAAPRIRGLGFLPASPGGDAELIEAVVSSYQTRIELTDEELARLPGSLRAFPPVLECWGFVHMGAPPAAVGAKLDASRGYGASIAERARRAVRR